MEHGGRGAKWGRERGARAANCDLTARARARLLGEAAPARENWPAGDRYPLRCPRETPEGEEEGDGPPFSALRDRGIIRGRISARSVMGEGFEAERTPQEGEEDFLMGELGSLTRRQRGVTQC